MTKIFTAIGNACTDLVAQVDEDFLSQHNITKSICGHLQSADELADLMAHLGRVESYCGGAGANVAHVVSALGGASHFISKIGDDDYGHAFQTHLQQNGVTCHFPPPCPAPLGSTIVITLITPDGERTFVSYDVAARTMEYDDYDAALLNRTDYLYLDGYCFCSPYTGHGFMKAAEIVRNKDGHVTFNIGDISYFETNGDEIKKLLAVCDSVMVNAAEATVIFGSFSSLPSLLNHLSERFAFGAVTLGADGAMVFRDGEIVHIPAIPVAHVVDTNGAGDHFSGGFIGGLMRGYSLTQAGQLAALCAGDCVTHAGARPPGGFGSLNSLSTRIED